MRILVVQLSDIHMHVNGNALTGRGALVAAAVRGLDPAIDAGVLLVTGDVAQSGADDEYMAALEFLDDVQRGLTSALRAGVPVHTAVIPGNHDCDLRGAQGARDALRERVLTGKASATDPSIIEICTAVQRQFFEFRDVVMAPDPARPDGPLYYERRFAVGGESVEVRCLNTAWLSQRHESEGTLYFPVALIPDRNADAAVAITILHHPFNWFPNENRRALQRRVEQVSDIIFTGHEHAHSRRTQVVGTGEVNEFIEGVALQVGADPSESGFHALVLDTGAGEERFCRFTWEPAEALYVPDGDAAWQPFQVNRLRARKDFELAPAFEAYLDDPEAAFEKHGAGRIRLSDVYVFPELGKVSPTVGDRPAPVKGEDLFDDTTGPANLLITGADQSGKTCLAKAVFQRVRARGLVPVLIDGAQFSPVTGRAHEAVERVFAAQYDPSGAQRYRQLERGRRVIVVDNLHKLRARPERISAILDELAAFAGRIILLTNDVAHAVGEIVRAGAVIEGRGDYGHYRILPFGHVKRGELTERWHLLGDTLDDEQFAQRLRQANTTLDVVLGRNFVPAFPVFILAMLQGLDTPQGVDVGASTYGYFYELLLRNALAAGSNQGQYSERVSYLASVAFAMYSQRRGDLTHTEIRELTAAFITRYDVDVDVRSMTDDLVRRLVLVRSGDAYEFKYRYIYYYFVASYLRDHITEEPIRDAIRALSRRLSDEESANIMLFLAHVSTEPLIIEVMLEDARTHFANVAPAHLEDDVAFLTRFAPPLPELTYEERDVTENRRESAVHRDALERSSEAEASGETRSVVRSGDPAAGGEPDAESEQYALAQAQRARILTALKTLQILGQVLKNFESSIEADRKEAIARECYALGFRILADITALLREGRADLVAYVVSTLREEEHRRERRSGTEADVLVRANAVVFGLGLVAAFGIVKAISFAVGSPRLNRTYRRVAAAMPTVATRLVNLSVQLDQSSGFPRGEITRLAEDLRDTGLPLAVLQWMVLAHINLFPVQFQEKQRVCTALGIKYTPQLGVNARRRLLAQSSTG